MRTHFQAFAKAYPYLESEERFFYFSLLGGLPHTLPLLPFHDPLEVIETLLVEQFDSLFDVLSPSYILEEPYVRFLRAVAQGDGKKEGVFRKARLGEQIGERLLDTLLCEKIITIEYSREAPLAQAHPKAKLKKSLRGYKIEDKLRFTSPFLRFWFGWVMPYAKEIQLGQMHPFRRELLRDVHRLTSLSFEQLSMELLKEHYAKDDPLVEVASFWNVQSEFDIFAVTQSGKRLLAECKYKERKVVAKEFQKLQQKAKISDLKVDSYILFSKSGFSRELERLNSQTLLRFSLDDFERLLIS